MLYGALEAGGTKMVCAVGNENGVILDQETIPTTTPDETMPKVIEYFKAKIAPELPDDDKIVSLGIACFGPVDVRKGAKTYGNILNTPKIPWRNFPMVQTMKDALGGIPIGFDTDVNGSLLGEATWGCAKGLTDAIYFTIGTGIGMGAMSGGNLIHGMLHPEAGHLIMSRVQGDEYKGHCPSHGACFEGMACGPAIEDRWGKSAKELADRPEVWELEAKYIAQALTDITMTLSPQKIILGGGVMSQSQLFPLIRKYLAEYINDYISTKELRNMSAYVCPAALNGNQGIMGAVKLAVMAAEEEE
ncbi:MAG: ROK family protein [Synergistaceae bacterium]|nr:ROK family protein [Synergistaceae bacterium]MBQ6918912.1 ROK family protein [Synergistaceae bacterium]MBQ7268017.1 ROK family protein [Synergistaceae bacterium]